MTTRARAAKVAKQLTAAQAKVAALRDERDALIRVLRDEGLGLQAIADVFGVSRAQVGNVLAGDRTGGSYDRYLEIVRERGRG